MKRFFKSSKGFTLIELLIVIAVLGILAAVVLVAIDPVEQLRRGRDSSRLQEVATLGHSVAAFYTAQGTLLSTVTTPAAFSNANWQTILVNSGDLKGAVSAPATGSACGLTGATNGSSQGTLCYGENGVTDYLIWTRAEANSARTKGQCTAAQFPVFVYDSTVGRAGTGCLGAAANAPTAGITLY